MKKFIAFVVAAAMVVLLTPMFTGAVFEGTDGERVNTNLEVSKDGVNWLNFYNNDTPGGQILYVTPGDTLTFRTTSWNDVEAPVATVTYKGTFQDSQYFEPGSIDPYGTGKDDLDGNNNKFSAGPLTTLGNDTNFEISLDNPLTVDSVANAESGTISAKLASNIPDQTVINVIFIVTSATRQLLDLNYSNQAFAQAPGEATVRIVVQNPTVTAVPVLPKTGAHR